MAALSVQALARELGVTKGSFYWHFANRQALIDAVMATWEDVATEAIIRQVDSTAPTAEDRIRQLIEATFAPGEAYNAIESRIRQWAASDPAAATIVARVDGRRLTYVRDLLVDAGVPREAAAMRADLFYRALIGEWAWCSHGGPPLSRDALEHLAELVTT